MTMAEPESPEGFAADALEGAVASAFFIPAIQLFLLTFFDALPESSIDTSVTALAILALIGLNLLPLASTLVSMAAAYVAGGPVGAVLYVIMSVAASAIFGAPVMGIIVLIVALLAMMVWLYVYTRQQSANRRGGLR